ncbi:hypothetical protein CAPTEDRAFT_211441 [Capitella teleta]|uniref:NACHT domain-containing protein n=1 Tax=Capitella teleta TaxID=283909 RepID=R7TNH1_CAPTE|nr:hypothetical protein CAPTEDRAFT_211441 [Capitella teleta]|eukprot:ELT93096.1 hypothetical protein CAPTEDRAFT_211441 [Capitella teleta]
MRETIMKLLIQRNQRLADPKRVSDYDCDGNSWSKQLTSPGAYQQILSELRSLHDCTDTSACNGAGISLYQPPTLYLHHDLHAKHERSNLGILQIHQRTRKGHDIEVSRLFENTEEGSMFGVHHILLIGRPAIGKTCFLRKTCQDWANGKLWPENFDCVFLFQLREFNQDDILKKGISLRKLLMERHGPEKPDEDIIWNQLKPNKCLIIFDGLDEFKGFEELPPKDPPKYSSSSARMRLPFLLWNLLKGNIFKGCYVICSSRPRALALPLLQDLFQRNVDLHGFDEAQVVAYFQLYSKPNLSTIQCQEMLRHSENVLSVCYIPAMCHCMAEILSKTLESTDDWRQKPETWTETMLVALMYLLHKHHPKYVQQKHELSELDDILVHFCEPLSKLAELALWCTHNDPMKIIFTSQDLHRTDLAVNQAMFDMGVLNYFKTEYQGLFKTVIENYSFLHLVFMEFFAALGLALDPMKSREVFMKTSGDYEMINLFLVGFLGNRTCRRLVQKLSFLDPEHLQFLGFAQEANETEPYPSI